MTVSTRTDPSHRPTRVDDIDPEVRQGLDDTLASIKRSVEQGAAA